MKKIFRIVACSALVWTGLACSKAEQTGPGEHAEGTISVSIDGLIDNYAPEAETKSEVQTVARILWSDGDKVHVFDGARHIGILAADITGTDGLYAKLNGTIQTPSGSVITLVHSPQLPEDSAPALNGSKLCLDLSQQEGSKLPFLVYGTLPAPDSDAISDVVVKFSLATSVYKVNCTGLPESGNIIRAQICDANTVCALSLSADSEPVVSGENPGRISRTGDGAFQAKDERAYISFAVVKTDGGDRKVTIRKTTGLYYASFDNKSFDASKAYNIVVCMKNYYRDGALQGTFTVGGKKYCFARGNLWYGRKNGADEATFNFEESQLDFSATWNADHISHFYWSRSDEESRGVTDPSEPASGNLLFTEHPDFTANGQNSMWHAPSLEEWYEILANNCLPYGRAQITDSKGDVHNGVMLLPDDFINPLDKSFSVRSINEYTMEEFAKMEYEGVAFLPNAGWRRYNEIYETNESGIYYPSTLDRGYLHYYSYVGDEVMLSSNPAFSSISAASLRLVSEM